MATLKDVKTKISGVKKTKQITKAMKMVATSKLRGCQLAMETFRPYANKFSEVLGSVVNKTKEKTSPLLTSRDDIRNVHIVLITSDRGLCGGFNINLLQEAESLMNEKVNKGQTVSLTHFGKKGRDWSRQKKLNIVNSYLGVVGSKFDFTVASKAGKELINGFLDQSYDEVYLIYATFLNMATQRPVVKKLLPIPGIENKEVKEEEETVGQVEHLIEPSSQELLNEMLPKNINIQIYNALLETSTSEHASRMRAMENATKACDDMIDSLTLMYNKARQAAITKELMDIVGGAEALRG